MKRNTPALALRERARADGAVVFGGVLLFGFLLQACVPQEKETEFEAKIIALCEAEGFQKGSQEFKQCVEETRALELEAIRAAYQRLLRGEGID